ncbi:MAG: ribosomal protein S18-alanine N-acetyltransferase [Rubrivivax sp.]|jgi:ribosomal-protein-alanine N-acetyltransferase
MLNVSTHLPDSLYFRSMVAADLEPVMALEVQAYSFPWSRGNFIDSLAAGYHALLLCSRTDHGGGPAEQVLGYLVAMPGVDEMHLLNITVAPDWQGRGLAHRLMDALQQHALQHHMPTLWLEVRRSNQRAAAFYGRRGFQQVGLRRGYYPAGLGQREDALVMRLDLSPPPPAP